MFHVFQGLWIVRNNASVRKVSKKSGGGGEGSKRGCQCAGAWWQEGGKGMSCKYISRSVSQQLYFQAQEDVSKNLVHIKNMLYGTAESEPQADIVVAQLAQELYNSNLLLLLVQNLSRIDFEVNPETHPNRR